MTGFSEVERRASAQKTQKPFSLDDFLNTNPEFAAQKRVLEKNQELQNAILTLAAEIAALKEECITDALTGVYNRRHYERSIQAEIKRAERYGNKVSCAYIDLDNFKAYNDLHGHLEGNKLLIAVSDIFKKNTRTDVDLVFRVGGDEFAILFPETPEDKAKIALERIQKGILEAHLNPEYGLKQETTISIGVASYNNGYEVRDCKHLEELADSALYQAKSQENSIICHQDIIRQTNSTQLCFSFY